MSQTRKMIMSAFFTCLTCLGAFIRIPLPFVPLVLQGIFVLLSGIVLGSKWGMISQLTYLTLGLIGLPLFTSGGGVGYIFHPTFGYLIGYVVSAYIVGLISEKAQKLTFTKALAITLLGTAIIYIIGVPYLALIMKFVYGMNDTLSYAVTSGFLITLPGDIIKAVVVAIVSTKIPSRLLQ